MKGRKLTALLLGTVLLAGAFTGCGESTKTEGTESMEEQTSGAESTQETETGEASDAQNAETEEEARFEIPDVEIEAYEIPDTEALAFVRNLKIGWNLGNTFDAYQESGLKSELDSETCWGAVATTKEMIDDLKEAGFNAVRIPVTWHTHVDEEYQISEVWLNRVQEVVDYVYDNGMYVILNIHHDDSEQFLYPSTEYLEQSVRYVTTIWKQLSERFAEYDEHMIFECMNEPRQVGTDWEWYMNGSEGCKDAVECINRINQAFVDTVRESGGNNTQRYLMLPGYDASPDGALNSGFVLPTDVEGAQDKLIISVHAYTPYGFALQADGESGSSSAFDSDTARFTADIDSFMDKLYKKYVANGIPVVIGEFGSRDKKQNTQARIDHATYYVAAARARGMSCFWWDNNAFTGNGENFGLYYRRGGYFLYPELITGLMKYAD